MCDDRVVFSRLDTHTDGHVEASVAGRITITSLAVFIFGQLTLHCLFPKKKNFYFRTVNTALPVSKKKKNLFSDS
jgi:hypothetical protein